MRGQQAPVCIPARDLYFKVKSILLKSAFYSVGLTHLEEEEMIEAASSAMFNGSCDILWDFACPNCRNKCLQGKRLQ